MTSGGFCKEMLTFEPVRMVHMKLLQQPLQQYEDATTTGLKTLELSNLDQLYDYYNSLALFYDVKDGSIHSIHNLANKLHTALEELLIHFPAAAGRLHINDTNGRLEVKYKPTSSSSSSSCSTGDHDYGLPFIVAHANTTLSRLGDVSAPHPSLDLLYPSVPNRTHNNLPPPPVVVIQMTMFTCGSFTMALMASHTLMDAYSVAIFLKNLCSIAKGEGISISMDMMNRREVLKPSVPPSPTASYPHICTLKRGEESVKKEKELLLYGEATRFSFSKATLEALRQRASNSNTKLCSRFQALVALLWRTRAKWLAKSSTSPTQELPLRFPINVRSQRQFSLFTSAYMGNAVILCSAPATVQELCESSLGYVVQKIMSSMEGILFHMPDYLQSAIDYIELQLQNGLVPSLTHALSMPSLVNLPFYDTDCGWGRPIYCGRPCRQLTSRIIILEDPQSKGWNVLAVMSSPEEHELFQEEISNCISAP